MIRCLKNYRCYTSVLNASEIFSGCINKEQLETAKNAFYGTSVLGIPYKYSLSIAEVLKEIKKNDLKNTYRDAVIASLCIETKLPFLTLNEENYRDLFSSSGIQLISKELIIQNNSPEIVFNKVKIL